jgi:hypothetical protein
MLSYIYVFCSLQKMERMTIISKIYVSDWVITMNFWDMKGDSLVTKLSNRHKRHYAITTTERERIYVEYARVSYFSKCMKLF